MPTLSSTLGGARRLATSRSGVLGLTTVGSLVIRMGSSVVMTRLLAPEAFGLVGIIGSIFFVIGMLTDLGFQSHIVRHPAGEDPHFLDVLWTIHAWRGAMLAVVGIVLAPVVGWVLAKPEITWPLATASLTLLLGGLGSFGPIIALRQDGARFLSLFELAMALAGALFGILLAFWLRNVWALIGSMLFQSGMRSLLSWYIFPDTRRRVARDPRIVGEFFAFSRLVMASSTLTLVQAQADKLIFARLFTLAEFGLYGLALNLASAPLSFADGYVHRVMFPAYARAWREVPAEIGNVFYQLRRKTSLLYGAGAGGMIGGAGFIVGILYDPRYMTAASYLSLLAVSSVLRFPNLATAELMTAIGRVKATIHGNGFRLGWILLGAWPAYHWGGAMGLVAIAGSIEFPAYVFNCVLLRRAGVLKPFEELLYLGCALAGTLAGLAATDLLYRLTTSI